MRSKHKPYFVTESPDHKSATKMSEELWSRNVRTMSVASTRPKIWICGRRRRSFLGQFFAGALTGHWSVRVDSYSKNIREARLFVCGTQYVGYSPSNSVITILERRVDIPDVLSQLKPPDIPSKPIYVHLMNIGRPAGRLR